MLLYNPSSSRVAIYEIQTWSSLCLQMFQHLMVPSHSAGKVLSKSCGTFIVKPLWPSNAMVSVCLKSWALLVQLQVMACYLMAPSHYLNQYWCIMSEVPWHSFYGDVYFITHYIPKSCLKFTHLKSPRGLFYLHGSTLIPAWIGNYIHYKA